jgi:hypothetical protein
MFGPSAPDFIHINSVVHVAIKLNSKENFRTATTMLLYILQTIIIKSAYFREVYCHMFSGPIGKRCCCRSCFKLPRLLQTVITDGMKLKNAVIGSIAVTFISRFMLFTAGIGPGREPDYSRLSISDIKIEWSYTSTLYTPS